MDLLVTWITIVANLLLGVSVFQSNPKSVTNKLFFLLTSIIILWTTTNYFSLQTLEPQTALVWIRIVMSVVALMFPTIFILAHTFPRDRLNLNKTTLASIVIWTAVIVTLALSSFVFSEVKITNNEVTPIPGPAIPIYGLTVLTYLCSTVFILYKKIKRLSGTAQVQVKFMLLGLAATFILSFFTTFIFVVILKITNFVILGPTYSLFLVASIAYAIVRHRFLDIRLVVARSVTYSLLVLILGFFYAGGLFLAGRFFIKENASIANILTSTGLALLVALTFQPLRRLLEKATNKIFYRDRYDPNILLGKLSRIMASTYELSKLCEFVLNEMLLQMKVKFGILLLTKDKSITWVKSEGDRVHSEFNETDIDLLIHTAKTRSNGENLIVFEELPESDLKEVMRKNNFYIVLPLTVEQETIGGIFLGEKSSGDIYSGGDIEVFKILTPEVAVAVKNALSYEEIRRFNITLQEEVERATAELRSANDKLQELDKLKDEFVSLASHELRTPMTAIKGSLSTILDGYTGEVSAQAKEFLTAAYNENDRLIRLVNNLLNISRIEAGRFTFTVIRLDMEKLINEVIYSLEPAAKERNIFLKYEKVGPLPPILGDEDKVKEVLINLVGNATKFTHKDGITIRAVVKDNIVITSVTDTGSGIAQEDMDRLFKKFSQVGGDYARPAGGTGLGLYISKQIVEGLKGKIWLESQLGVGSTFYFSLPIAN